MVARRGSPADAGLSMNGQHAHPRATMKAHPASTQPPSPLRNPGLGLRLMPIEVSSGHPWSVNLVMEQEMPAVL